MTDTSIISKNGITRISSSLIIESSIESIWNILKRFGEIEKFHPLIKRSYSMTEQKSGIGAKRHCVLLPMGEMDEVITEWIEGKSFTAEVYAGKMLPPCHFMRGEIRLEPEGNRSRVTFTFTYQLKYGFVGKLMDRLLIRPQFRKGPPRYVEGLKKYMEQVVF